MSEEFAEWLKREMPAGTVISDPEWWAPRILKAARTAPAEPLAWVSQCRTSGLIEQCEPNEKVSNPAYWTDAFPVYTAPDALQAEVDRLREEVERLKEELEENNSDAAVAAIKYALEHWTEDPVTFLECWMDGDFSSIREEWDDVPDEVFIGADPLFKRTANPEVKS